MRREDWQPSRSGRIYEKHFLPSDYQYYGCSLQLFRKTQSLIDVLMQSVRWGGGGQMAFFDILRTFDCIPPLDAFLVFSASICLEISNGLTWVDPKDGNFPFFL